ncbi:MAG: HD domain-containing phosphohydrolase [Pyrinomonadaceae bacterium]
MTKERTERRGSRYQTAVTVAGISLWAAAALYVCLSYQLPDQLILLAFVPLVIIVSMFPNSFPLPSGMKLTKDKVTFSLSDALILLVACSHGVPAAIFIAGLEGFTSSRRAVRRLSSNLFSFGMMSLAAAAAAGALFEVLHYGWGIRSTGLSLSIPAVLTALLVASMVHCLVNTGLLSALFALRQATPLRRVWRENFLWAVPMFLPTSALASLMYIALQYDVLITFLICAPILLAIYYWHRRYRNGIHELINVMEKAHAETIEALAVAINAKDEVTHEHVLRVQIYARGVARLLGCNEAEIEALKAGALLHDIGKIAVPDYILNKPGKLTAAEFEKMKLHTIVGAQILGRVGFHYPVVPIVRHHHERWDGRGYPDSLAGEEIPLTARILTVVDCFDAVREDRQYRKGMTREEAIDFLMTNSGSQYDPRVVGTFVTHLPEFEAEIAAHREVPLPTFGIEPAEQLSEAAREVPPAAGLSEAVETEATAEINISHKELAALYQLAQGLGGARSRAEATAVFAEKLRSIVPYDSCAVTIIAPETGENIVEHAAGQHAAEISGRRITLGEGVTGWVIANGTPFCNTDPKLDFPASLAERFAGYRTIASFPIQVGKEMLGAVTLYSSALSEYSTDHRKLLKEAVTLFSPALSSLPNNAATAAGEPLIAPLLPSLSSPSFQSEPTILESELAH